MIWMKEKEWNEWWMIDWHSQYHENVPLYTLATADTITCGIAFDNPWCWWSLNFLLLYFFSVLPSIFWICISILFSSPFLSSLFLVSTYFLPITIGIFHLLLLFSGFCLSLSFASYFSIYHMRFLFFILLWEEKTMEEKSSFHFQINHNLSKLAYFLNRSF